MGVDTAGGARGARAATLEGCPCGAPDLARPLHTPGTCVRCILAADGLTPVGSCLEPGTIRPWRSSCSFMGRRPRLGCTL